MDFGLEFDCFVGVLIFTGYYDLLQLVVCYCNSFCLFVCLYVGLFVCWFVCMFVCLIVSMVVCLTN